MLKKMLGVLTIAIFVMATFVMAVEPKAVIQAKGTAAVGQSVWIKTDGAVGKSFAWKVIPPELETDFTVLPIFSGMDKDGVPLVTYWAHFASQKTSTVYFLFIATEDNKSDVAVHQLLYGVDVPGPVIPDNPTPDPVLPDLAKPTVDLIPLVQPITVVLKMSGIDKKQLKKDIVNLRQFYLDMADTVERDSTKTIKTTEDLRKVNMDAGKLMFQNTGIKGRYVNLGATIDKALSDKIGLDIVDFTDAKRVDTVAIFKAIAWAVAEAGK